MMEPLPLRQHARQERLDRAVHGLDVEVEGEVPVLVGAVEHRAVMHEARRVEQHVDRAQPLGLRLDGLGVARIELHALGDAGLLQLAERRLVDVAGDHLGAFARKGDGRGPADAGARRRAERELALETIGHASVLPMRCRAHGPHGWLAAPAGVKRPADAVPARDRRQARDGVGLGVLGGQIDRKPNSERNRQRREDPLIGQQRIARARHAETAAGIKPGDDRQQRRADAAGAMLPVVAPRPAR